MKERAISVRLDDAAINALGELMRDGRSRSQAIRDALMIALERDESVQMHREWVEMQNDPQDQEALRQVRRDFFGEG